MDPDPDRTARARHLRRALRMTRIGMFAERFTRAFWPAWSVLFAGLALVMFGAHETAPVEAVWIGGLVWATGLLWGLVSGLRQFRWPSPAEAAARLDSTLPGRPLQALSDFQAIGVADAESSAVWEAHQRRMEDRAAAARAVSPDLKLSRRDPFALRYVALTALVVALLFGSLWRIATVPSAVVPGGNGALAAGPSWEGWIEPPLYTGKPSLYLADLAPGRLEIPAGSQVTIRLYGEIGALSVEETVSGRAASDVDPSTAEAQEFDINQGGRLAINGPGGRVWDVILAPDAPPTIRLQGALEVEASGRMSQKFLAEDDYGVTGGQAVLALDLPSVPREHGLAAAPDPREPILLDLPVTISGDRSRFVETLVEDFSKHPWVGLTVTLTLTAEDAAGQSGGTAPNGMTLPGRRFFDPLAAALIEQRRDLLWTRDNGTRVAQVLRAVTHRPDEVLRDAATYLPLRVALTRLEAAAAAPGGVTPEVQDEVAEALWAIAVGIEEGDLSDAMERLRRAQDRLAEAIRNGASDQEIAQLMDELREALQEYMQQLAQQQDPNAPQEMPENAQTMSGDQLQELLDRLQQLMEEGRTAEAMALLEQLRQMMENMQVAQGQGGQGSGQSPGQQAMQGLAETLRDQQGLSDEAFNQFQDQFNPNGGQQPGQGQGGQQPGQQGQQGQQGQWGQQPGGSGQSGQDGTGPGDGAGPLADRQGDLRRRLDALRGTLPGAGTEAGDAAREALGEAGEAMDRAEDALRGDDLAGAIDEQSRAMESIREGMRSLGEAMAEMQRQPGGQGEQVGEADGGNPRDPLGRRTGNAGTFGTEDQLLQGDDVYRRARDLLDELRRRSSDRERPEAELDYLRRLLDRF